MTFAPDARPTQFSSDHFSRAFDPELIAQRTGRLVVAGWSRLTADEAFKATLEFNPAPDAGLSGQLPFHQLTSDYVYSADLTDIFAVWTQEENTMVILSGETPSDLFFGPMDDNLGFTRLSRLNEGEVITEVVAYATR